MLEITSARIAYGKREVVRDLSLIVRDGEVVALIGPNSAGKTSSLRAIAGLKELSGGGIRLAGIDMTVQTVANRVRAGLILVPEGRQIFPRFSVRDNLAMGAFHRGDRNHIGSDIERIYEIFPRLKERESQDAGSMSGGEQQMLAIGRGLMAKPSVMLLDEPTLGLAPIVVEELKRVIRTLAQGGMSILLAEQNQMMAVDCSDRGYVIDAGAIVEQGPSAVLAKTSCHTRKTDFAW